MPSADALILVGIDKTVRNLLSDFLEWTIWLHLSHYPSPNKVNFQGSCYSCCWFPMIWGYWRMKSWSQSTMVGGCMITMPVLYSG